MTRPSITLDDDDDEGLLLLLLLFLLLEVVRGGCDDFVVFCVVASGVPDMMSPRVPDPTISISSLSVVDEELPFILLLLFSSFIFDRIDDFDSSE